MKRILPAILMTAALLLCLTACTTTSTSTSTTTVSVTDEDGNTTTTTTTKENGVESSSTTVTNADGETFEVSDNDPTGLRGQWPDMFSEGAEGTNEDGETFFFAYDDPDNLNLGAVMIINAEQTELETYVFGEITYEDDTFTIHDVEGEESMPFSITNADENGFTMVFQDGDTASMEFVDQDTIIDDMLSIWESVNAAE